MCWCLSKPSFLFAVLFLDLQPSFIYLADEAELISQQALKKGLTQQFTGALAVSFLYPNHSCKQFLLKLISPSEMRTFLWLLADFVVFASDPIVRRTTQRRTKMPHCDGLTVEGMIHANGCFRLCLKIIHTLQKSSLQKYFKSFKSFLNKQKIRQWGRNGLAKNSYFERKILVTKTYFLKLRLFCCWTTLWLRLFFSQNRK